jgi:excisionase family DNA binding protein
MQNRQLPEATVQRRERTIDLPIWVTVNDAIRLTSIKRTRLYELIGDGTLKSIRLGGKRLISYASITELGATKQAVS